MRAHPHRHAILLAAVFAVFGLRADPTPETATVWFPEGTSFHPLVADPDEARSFLSLGRLDMLEHVGAAGLVGVGNRIGLRRGPVWQTDAVALIRSQFDLDQVDPAANQGGSLINTDFIAGISLTRAWEDIGLRLRATHRSSHLGDEFLIENPRYLEERVNISYESVDALFDCGGEPWRVYLGGRVIVHSQPGSLAKLQVQTGAEWRGSAHPRHRWVSGVDLKMWDETPGEVRATAKAGVEIPRKGAATLRLLIEAQAGPSPYGQFITEDATYAGLTLDYAF